jgi:hypothetical protein
MMGLIAAQVDFVSITGLVVESANVRILRPKYWM